MRASKIIELLDEIDGIVGYIRKHQPDKTFETADLLNRTNDITEILRIVLYTLEDK